MESRETWLRNSFEFAYVSQFLAFFHTGFGLDTFSYHDLEGLLLWEPDHITGNTTKLFKKILKALPSARFTSTDNWFQVLGKEYKKRGMEKPFEDPADVPLELDEVAPPELTLNDLSLEVKVQILFDLCEFLMENIQSFHDHVLKGYDAGVYWRLEPLGRDFTGMQFWAFDDGRLFREHVDSKTGLSTSWELVCYNLQGWEEFKGLLTNRPADRKLKSAIEERWADIEAALIEQDKVAKKKAKELYSAKMAFDLIPRKRSSRLQAKEAIQKLRDQEEEEERAARLRELAESNKSRGLPAPVVAVPGGLTREERAEQRRLRLEREANEKVLKELEAEHATKPEVEEKIEVDVISQDHQADNIEAPLPLKITIRRSSIPTMEPVKKKKAALKPKTDGPPVDPQKQKMLELMEQAIQRELAQRLQRPPLQNIQQRPQYLPQQQQQHGHVHQQFYGQAPMQQYGQPPMQQYGQPPIQPYRPMINPYGQMYPPMQYQPGQMNQHPMMPFQQQQFQQHQQQQQQHQMFYQQYQPRPIYNAPSPAVASQMPTKTPPMSSLGQSTPIPTSTETQQVQPSPAESSSLNNEHQ